MGRTTSEPSPPLQLSAPDGRRTPRMPLLPLRVPALLPLLAGSSNGGPAAAASAASVRGSFRPPPPPLPPRSRYRRSSALFVSTATILCGPGSPAAGWKATACAASAWIPAFSAYIPAFSACNARGSRQCRRQRLGLRRCALLLLPRRSFSSGSSSSDSDYASSDAAAAAKQPTLPALSSSPPSLSSSPHNRTEAGAGAGAAAARRTNHEVQMADDAILMVRSAIAAVDPYRAVASKLSMRRAAAEEDEKGMARRRALLSVDGAARTYDLHRDHDQVVLVGFGKASAAMAAAVLHVLFSPSGEDDIDDDSNSAVLSKDRVKGLVIVKDGHATSEQLQILKSHNVEVREASHPVPDQRSVHASTDLLELVKKCAATHKERALVVCCISGGGSSLFCAPVPPLTLDDLQRTNRVLLRSGWDIRDMNTVRKQLELGKGGRLAAAAHPGRLLSLVLSDVVGDPLDLIASGPTVPNPTTAMDAWNLIQQRRGLPSDLHLPSPVLDLLRAQAEGRTEGHAEDAQPTPDHPAFRTSYTTLVGNNGAAVRAAADEAARLGYHPVVLATQMTGEASQVAPILVAMAHQLQLESSSPSAYPLVSQLPAALILGGETTVTLPPGCAGKGGRNQELALRAAAAMRTMGVRNAVVASAGTDGGDGPTDAAGAVVDGGTIDRLGGVQDAEGALKDHNAYPYLSRQDASGWSPLLKTGPTGTNVADICLVLVQEP